MGYCPNGCAEDTLLVNQTGEDCDLEARFRQINKVGFFMCNTDLPNPLTCAALQALIDSEQLTFTSPLANVEVGDPTFIDIQIAGCLPTRKEVDTRVINFQDRIGVTGGEGSPATDILNFEYNFWADKIDKQSRLRALVVYCDGAVVVCKDKNGEPLELTLNAFLKYENVGSASNQKVIQYVQGALEWKGDPLALTNKPELTAGNAEFNINSCSF